MERKAKIYYTSLDDFWRKEEKLAWLRDNHISKIEFERLKPDAKHNWISIADNDWENLIPLIDKDVKLGRKEEAVFKLFSLGVVTARDEWVYGFDEESLAYQIQFLIDSYNRDLELLGRKSKDEIKDLIGKREKRDIKWTRAVVNDLSNGKEYKFNGLNFKVSTYRPFIEKILYFTKELNEMQYQMPKVFQKENIVIAFSGEGSSKPFQVLGQNKIFNHDLLEKTQSAPLYFYNQDNEQKDNITDRKKRFRFNGEKTNRAEFDV